MKQWTTILTGASVGACVMYFFDPDLGPRRRAQARDQLRCLPNSWQDAVSVTARDLKNRTVGLFEETRARLSPGEVDDEVLFGRVRSKLGFLVRHPSAIEVGVESGRVTLRGPVLSDEVEQLVDGVRAVRGVDGVENRLEVHAEPGSVSMLQGNKPKPTGQPLDIMQRHWSPATRFLVGTAGALLVYNISRRTDPSVLIPGSLLLGFTAYRLGDGAVERLPRRQKRANSKDEVVAGWSG